MLLALLAGLLLLSMGYAAAQSTIDYDMDNYYSLSLIPIRPPAVQFIIDYDTDDDGLIEIATTDQLGAIRWDLNGNGTASTGNIPAYNMAFPYAAVRMGCPAGGCIGYELVSDLDLNGTSWKMIGSWASKEGFTGIFNGNGHAIRNSFAGAALFSYLEDTGEIHDLQVLNVNIDSFYEAAALVNKNFGLISGVYVDGSVSSSNPRDGEAGMLAARHEGTIIASYATGVVSSAHVAGGLVGAIVNDYAGGRGGGDIISSYSLARLGGSGALGGLVGVDTTLNGVVTDSYWDSDVSGMISSAGGIAKTTAELQVPTTYTGIYANWENLDTNLDGISDTNTLWDFGTESEYPRLHYQVAAEDSQPSLSDPIPVIVISNNATAEVLNYTVRQFESKMVNFSAHSDSDPISFIGISGNATAFSTVRSADGYNSVLLEPTNEHFGNYTLKMIIIAGDQASMLDAIIDVGYGSMNMLCSAIPELFYDEPDPLQYYYFWIDKSAVINKRQVVPDISLFTNPDVTKISVSLFDGKSVVLTKASVSVDEHGGFNWRANTGEMSSGSVYVHYASFFGRDTIKGGISVSFGNNIEYYDLSISFAHMESYDLSSNARTDPKHVLVQYDYYELEKYAHFTPPSSEGGAEGATGSYPEIIRQQPDRRE